MKVDSPVDPNISVLQEDLESITNSQKLIENTLKHIVDSIVSMSREVKDLKTEKARVSANECSETMNGSKYDINRYTINRELAESKEQVDLLNNNIRTLQNELGSIKESIFDFKKMQHSP